MARAYLKIHPADSVAVAVIPIQKNTLVEIDGVSFTILEDIPQGHKFALSAIDEGALIRKYGHVIGQASSPIARGAWVHAHNCKTTLKDEAEYAYAPVSAQLVESETPTPVFMGYKREDGRVGTRNEIWIINTVGCVNTSAERIAKRANERLGRSDNFDGVYTFSHPYGCSQLGGDLEKTQALLHGLMQHPNAGGVLVLGLGCENNQLAAFLNGAPNAVRRVRSFNAQDVQDEIETGVGLVEELHGLMQGDRRVEVPVSHLTLGMKCGGSDGFSGITANPLVGRITDTVTRHHGRVILTEVPEMFGAEQQLMDRAVSRDVFSDIVTLIEQFKQYFTRHNQPVYENPSPGNKAGGITTLEEKSLGAIQKGGSALVHEVLAYGQPVSTGEGMALLNAPGNDGVSGTAMAASGATMILFTTGRGTPLGFPVPTVKISTNSALALAKPGWIDFNAGALIDGTSSMEDLTASLMNFVIEAASGRVKTKNEINEYKEIAIWKEGVTL